MGKCVHCGRKGLFLKVDKDNLCIGCQSIIEAQSKVKRLDTEIQSKEGEFKNAERKLSAINDKLFEQREELNKLQDMIVREQSELEYQKSKNAKLKTMVSSIKAALAIISDVNMDSSGIEQKLQNLEIEELFQNPALNCLTMKELRTRYNTIRKQITEVCKAYEERYTTKTNAAIYKLMVLALEAELVNVLYKLQFGKKDTAIGAVRELTSKYYTIAADGNQSIAPTIKRFIAQVESLYIDIVETEYEYHVQRERAREEQRAIKEQMRQEAEERKKLEQEQKKVEAEEKKYQLEIDRISEQMKRAHDAELDVLKKRLSELEMLKSDVEKKKEKIINLQNGKAGTVYIISNIGSFGDNVFKIGMTRRNEAQDRVNELGDASVPFPFDVHCFIFSQDAAALETTLHHELNNRRVNKVNLRKEFFHITIEELEQIVQRIDPTAPFNVTALAEQYRQSLSIDEVPFSVPIAELDDEEIV